MSVDTIIIYSLALILLGLSFVKDKQKSIQALKKARKTFMKLMPVLIPLFLFVGILLTLVTPAFISRLFGEDSGLIGYVLALVIGSITFMSPFVAYPLGQSLIDQGAAVPQVAAFLVTLMSVGLVYFAMETKLFNRKVAIYRNLVSFLGAILVVLVVLWLGV
jgi:uncharacterized membrane protein YraQ (UPF0718 family)